MDWEEEVRQEEVPETCGEGEEVMSEPRIGMNYEEARKRVKRIMSSKYGDLQAKANLTNSILNQAERANKGARREIERELGYR